MTDLRGILGVALLLSACGGPEPAASDGETETGGPTDDTTGSGSEDSADDGGDDGDDDAQPDMGETEDDSSEVVVIRDQHGVPHIRAATDEGAFYGLGYATAEDRLTQMHLSVMAAQGRLSEVVGGNAIEADTQARVWGTWRHAQQAAANLDADHRGLLEAYAAGVNAYVSQADGDLPPAVADLGIEVQTWTPAHSLAVWYRLANFFSNDPSDKAMRYELFMEDVAAVGLDNAVDNLLQGSGGGNPSAGVVKDSDVPPEVMAAIMEYAASLGYGAADESPPPHGYGHESPKFSHAWAVAGDRTTTGSAVLVSDPQVPVMYPNLLYEFQMTGATFNARGIGAAGTPGLLIGYTPDIAWGMTAAGLDQRDLFHLAMTDDTHYTIDGIEHAIESEQETIDVKDGSPVTVEYRRSEWGPVVTDTLDDARNEYALKGIPFSEPETDTFVAMVEMMRATDLDGFRAALEDWRFPSANIVVATGADVFYTVVGAIPVRSLQSPVGGMIAQDGSSLAYDWLDIIPGEFKPWVLNPADGYIYSANHRIETGWYPLPLGVGVGAVGDTTRSRQLRELMAALPDAVEPRDVLDLVQYDCANSGRRDLAALGHHIRSLDPSLLSAPAHATLDALGEFSAAGGQMRTSQPGVGIAWGLSTKFRIQQTGSVLNDMYGGGESGLGMFLDDMLAQIATDPSYLPIPDAVAYVDSVLADASGGMSDAAYANNIATQTLPYLAAPDVAIDLGASYTTPVMECADGGTVWSQIGETYTQFVDLGAIDDAQSIMPPGNTEDTAAEAATSQAAGWISGEYKTAPLSANAIDLIEDRRYTLKYP